MKNKIVHSWKLSQCSAHLNYVKVSNEKNIYVKINVYHFAETMHKSAVGLFIYI